LGSLTLNVKLQEIFNPEILHGVPLNLHEEKGNRSVRYVTEYMVGTQNFIPRRNTGIFLSLPLIQNDCGDHTASIPMTTASSFSRVKDSSEKYFT
jgi:hypothetical protein